MSHGIMEDDLMISGGGVKPWHGLGIVLPDHPNVDDAERLSGLTWTVRLEPVHYNGTPIPKHRQFVIREDTNRALGVVGNGYVPYQNKQMWEFVEDFIQRSHSQIETAGSLWNGAWTWVLLKNGNLQYINDDTVEKYFLFRNSFDGSCPIQCLFTNVRVVCNNTINMAVCGARNMYSVKHTRNSQEAMIEVDKALDFRFTYEHQMEEAMRALARFQMNQQSIRAALNDLYPMKDDHKINTQRNKKLSRILYLVECGAGTDIAGVRGTGYGLLQAIIEHADHQRDFAPGRKDINTIRETRFRSILWGGGAAQLEKQAAFEYLLAKAA